MRAYALLLYLVIPIIISTFTTKTSLYAFAEDLTEEDLVDVDVEDGAVTGEDVDPEEDADSTATTSPYADTLLLFIKPQYTSGQQLDLPGGKLVECLVAFTNKGEESFVIDSIEASFRYPMDFNFAIQNFSTVTYNREVKAGIESTISYSFLPSDQYAGRPFGLNIALNYHDARGSIYNEALFNETVLISEVDEGLDGETFFLYILFVGIIVFFLVIGQHYLMGSSGKRKRSVAKKSIEIGTTNDKGIDFDFVPLEIRSFAEKAPKSPKTPRIHKTPKTPKTPKPAKPSKEVNVAPKPSKQNAASSKQNAKQKRVKQT